MNNKKIFLVLYLFILCPSLIFAKTIKIRVTNFPPQYYKNKSGEWTGIDVELARLLVKESGLEYKFVEMPWTRALNSLKSGKIDLMTSLSITSERMKFINFLGPERNTKMALFVNKKYSGLKINSLDDFKKVVSQHNKKFGLQKDIFYSNDFSKKLKKDPKFADCFEYTSKFEINLIKTNQDRILGFVEDYNSIMYKIKQDKKYSDLVPHPFTISEEPVFFGISNKIKPKYLIKLFLTYYRIVKSGKLEEVRKKLNEGLK